MTAGRTTIARVPLARSLPRLLVLPVIFFVMAGLAIAGGLFVVPDAVRFALVAVGALAALIGLALMVMLLSVRLDVEEAAVRVSWIGGGRIYVLSPGPVTRVRLRGPNASRLRVRSGAFGWALGRAVLRGEEPIEVVRLASTRTAILVPTDRGRLAIAPARDDDLLDALSRAARARQRLEAQAAEAAEMEVPETDAAAVAPAEAEAPPGVEAREVPEARPLTGIERAMLEERMAEERAAGLAAGTVVTEVEAPPAPEAEAPSAAEVEAPPAPEAEAEAAPRMSRVSPGMQRFGVRAAFVVLPLLGAGLAWLAGLASGRLPQPGTDLARVISLALVMAGPATSVGAVMALAWWPRLVGVVVTGGLVASVLIGRALIAP